MTTWITGANGFIGRHLARELANLSHEVYGLGHGAIEEIEQGRLGLKGWLNGDVNAVNLDQLSRRSGPPSTIFHLAGGSSVGLSIAQPDEDFSRTVSASARLLEWLRDFAPHCRLIAASSASVYGDRHDGAIGEDAEPAPVSPYGHHKLMMEQLCRSHADAFGLRCTVVRMFSVYGPGLRKQLPWEVCSRLQAGERMLLLGGTGSEMRDWTDVRDMVRLLAAFGARPPQAPFEVINGGSGRGTSVTDIAKLLVQWWGRDIDIRFSGVAREGDPFSLVAEDSRLRDMAFEWRVPIHQGLADYVRWFRDQAR